MRTRMALAALLLLSPGLAWGQTGPESVLPAKSQLYFRWDGAKAHRAEFEQTAWGKTLQGDTGKFFGELWKYVTENAQQALDQAKPDAGAIFKDATRALVGIAENGVVIGVELEKVNPPRVNAVHVFPKAAGESGTLLALIQKAAEASPAEIKDTKVGRRSVHHIEIPNVQGLYLGWWNEGDDAVVTLGTVDPAEYAKLVEAKQTGLAKNALYTKVRGFKDFTTSTRGYLDVANLLQVVEDLSPEAAKVVEALGVKGLKNITFVSGYEGSTFRSVVDVDMPGPRNGLLALASTRKFTLKDLPAMPSDTTSFSAATFDMAKVYDVLYQLVESGVRIFAPDQAENIPAAIKAFEGVLGVSFRDDLFGCFGDLAVSYSSPAEGPFGLGSTSLFKLKDGTKLVQSIETLVKNLPAMPGFELSLKKKKYHDVEMMEVHVKGDAFSSHVGSFAVYKDWFVFSQYPQGIKGVILRSSGTLPKWQASAELTKALEPFPKEFTAIEVSDPRPTLKFLFATTPFVLDIANKLAGFVPNLRQFDLDIVPHAQEATFRLFPRVSVTTDDGKKLRSETRSSLGLP